MINTYTIVGVTAGTTYLVKVRSLNIYGYGAFSSDFSIKASAVPSTVSTVTTTTIASNIEIAWTAPHDGNEAIDAYQVLIYLPSTATFVEDLTYCDGSNLVVLGALKCDIPISYLVSTYSFNIGDVV